ncbi:recombination activating protein 1 [Amycolatopsis sp. A1MSW2902]
MSQSSTAKPERGAELLSCWNCGEDYRREDRARHTEPVRCGPCIVCAGKPACCSCRLMYCVCEVHRYRG